MATHPRAIKPKYGKAFKDLTPRTQREWTKRFAEADAAGITTASGTVQFYLEQKNNYWIPRAAKLFERYPHQNSKKHAQWTLQDEERARLAVLGKVPQNYALAASRENNDYTKKWFKASRKDLARKIGKKEYENNWVKGDTP